MANKLRTRRQKRPFCAARPRRSRHRRSAQSRRSVWHCPIVPAHATYIEPGVGRVRVAAWARRGLLGVFGRVTRIGMIARSGPAATPGRAVAGASPGAGSLFGLAVAVLWAGGAA